MSEKLPSAVHAVEIGDDRNTSEATAISVLSPRPISAPTSERSDLIEGAVHEPRRCASQLDLTAKKDGPQLPGIFRSGVAGLRDINMSDVKDIDHLTTYGMRRLRFALQCRGVVEHLLRSFAIAIAI
jgi:hypothetical protein